MVKTVHLTLQDAESKISKLEEELQKPETKANKTKRKRLYAEIALLRKAVVQPDQYLVDPIEEAEKIKKDKERRIAKKIEKKKALLDQKKR